MHARHQGVDRCNQLLARWQIEHRSIVADTECDALRPAAERARRDAIDQCELAQRRYSSPRHCAATRSSTPLTNVWPCIAPNRLAISTASLITTR